MKKKHLLAYMKAAYVFAELSYCECDKVGCVIVKDDSIISIGYNGTPPGWKNCCEDEDGETVPEVIHAEMNALGKLVGSNHSARGAYMFVTRRPCMTCAKLIVARTGIERIYYATSPSPEPLIFLEKCGIKTIELTL